MSAGGDAENGRGLLLVDTLSTRWGQLRGRGGPVGGVEVPGGA